MPSWWGKSHKEVKKKSNGVGIVSSLHRKCIRPGAPLGQHSDSTSKESQPKADSLSLLPSKHVSLNHSFGEMPPQSQPLPLPGILFTNICHVHSGNSALNKPSLDEGPITLMSPPLPKPGHAKIKEHVVVGEGDMAISSNSSDTSSDSGDPPDSRPVSPEASDYENGIRTDTTSPSGLKQRGQFMDKKNSREMLKPANILLNYQIRPASPSQRPLSSKDDHSQPHHVVLSNAPDKSPSRSPVRVFGHEPVTNSGFPLGKRYTDLYIPGSGQCSSPGSAHNSGNNSVTGDMPCQLFWPQSRCSPECSPLPSPRMMSSGPSSRIHSGAVTPLHPLASPPAAESSTARPNDGRQRSHRLPLPPVKISNPSPFAPSYSSGTSPRVQRSPGRIENPSSPASRWKKGRLLGRGTFGQVYLGFNSGSGEMCAMKEVTLFSDDPKSKESAQQLGQEIALLSRLRHPNIVQYYGSEMVDDKLYIYLEYVSGGSIHKILQEYGHLGEAAIRSYTQQILSGLAYLHTKNTIHRDIKGANILVDPNGRVKLADFGMAKHITGQSCPLSFKGSPYWMAPEVITNSSGCNLAVDIWSLGCTVLEMATTKPPWSQYEGVAAMFKVGNSKELPELPDHLSDDGKDFVMKCLQRNPSYRPTAAQLLEHPFVKNSVFLERPVLSAEPLESAHALPHAVRAPGFRRSETSRCLDSSGAVNHPQSPDIVPGFSSMALAFFNPRRFVRSNGYTVRNIANPVSPSGNSLSQSPPPQHSQLRLSPSPMSSPRVAPGASTPPGGGSKGTVPPCHPTTTNYSHKPNIFRRVLQRAHSSVESLVRENDFLGNKAGRKNNYTMRI
ncbi:hypothetical protein OROMI_020449 [Orobanche minor]